MGKKLSGPSMKATKDELKNNFAEPADSLIDFYTRAPSDEWTTSQRLRFAVIEDAISILKKGPFNKYYAQQVFDYQDALAWIDGEVESAPTFSLSEIATTLDCDLSTIRSYMHSLKSDFSMSDEFSSRVNH